MEKVFEWNQEKNQKLIKERGISFEAVVSSIETESLVGIARGNGKFKDQKRFIVEVRGYIYIVPFVEDLDKIFLKTIIPSRKLTKKYLAGGDPT